MSSATTELAMADRLWPAGFLFSTGPLEGSRSADCGICVEPLAVDRPVLTHKSCMHSFCAEEILAWKTQQDGPITCPMCRGDLGELRPLGYDPKMACTILARDGLSDVIWLVSKDAFFKAPLRDRLVRDEFTHVDEICQPDTRYHPTMVGVDNSDLIETFRMPNDERDKDSALLEEALLVERAARSAAASILQRWHDVDGVRFVQQYYFPEDDVHTRIVVPIKPQIFVIDDVDKLRKLISRIRRKREAEGQDHWSPGWWLKRTMNTLQLVSSPEFYEGRGDAFARVMARVGPATAKERNERLQWALWQPNEPDNAILFACPRWKVTTSARRYQGRLVRDFGHIDETEMTSVTLSRDDTLNDPQLYDFADCFDDQYQGEDATIYDMAFRPLTDADLLQYLGSGEHSQITERDRVTRSLLAQVSDGRLQVPLFPFEQTSIEPRAPAATEMDLVDMGVVESRPESTTHVPDQIAPAEPEHHNNP